MVQGFLYQYSEEPQVEIFPHNLTEVLLFWIDGRQYKDHNDNIETVFWKWHLQHVGSDVTDKGVAVGGVIVRVFLYKQPVVSSITILCFYYHQEGSLLENIQILINQLIMFVYNIRFYTFILF